MPLYQESGDTIPDIPSLIALIFGGFILGGGYVALWVVFSVFGTIERYYKMHVYDKFFLNLFVGMILFFLNASISRLNFQEALSEMQLLSEVLDKISIVLLNEILLIITVWYIAMIIKTLYDQENRKRGKIRPKS